MHQAFSGPLPPSYRGTEPCAFVSYSHADGPVLWPEIARLQKLGYRIWYDEGIEPAGEWPEEIAQALLRSSLFICYLTPSAAISRHVKDEIHFALEHQKRALMVHWEPCELPSGLSLQLARRQAIVRHAMDAAAYDTQLRRTLDQAGCGTAGVSTSPDVSTTPSATTAEHAAVMVGPKPKVPREGWRVSRLLIGIAAAGAMLGVGSWLGHRNAASPSLPPFEQLLLTALQKKGPQGTVQATATLEVKRGGDDSLPYEPLREQDTLTPRDSYRLRFEGDRPAWIYIFQLDSQGKLAWLHPRNAFTPHSAGDNPIPANSTRWLPSEKDGYFLDEYSGQEHVFFVATPGPWMDLEQSLRRAVESGAIAQMPQATARTRGVGGVRPDAGSAEPPGGAVKEWLESREGACVFSWHFGHAP